MGNWLQKIHPLWGWAQFFLHEQRCIGCQQPFTPHTTNSTPLPAPLPTILPVTPHNPLVSNAKAHVASALFTTLPSSNEAKTSSPHSSHNTSSSFFCPQCLNKMPRKILGFCPLCAESTVWPLLPPTLCGACLQKNPPWQRLWFYAGYENTLRTLLLRFKFYNDVRLSHALASLLLTHHLFSLARYDVIVPIPLHPARLKKRGYNQALELCKALLALDNKPHKAVLTPKALFRIHPSLPQAGLSRKKRKENTKNIFSAGQVAGKRILLVDDIITTGETARAATATLLQSNAASVDIAVIAKTFARVR